MAAQLQSLQGALEGRYRVERELGRGGMATVFLAEDLRHHRRVAIKVLDPEVAGVIGPERFEREIETIANLTHPHILPLHDSGEAAGLLYYVMPYVEGESLRDRLSREGPLPVEDALRITREIADALAHAHAHGVVHRDIKPENVLLVAGHAVVADFGLARALGAVGAQRLTTAGMTVGTPAYMSPEQAAGAEQLDGRSDEYGLGCVLYELLAGQPPFTGPNAASLIHQHLNVVARPVTELRPNVPAPVRDALAKSLAKMPADRYATLAEFGQALAGPTPVPGTVASPVPATPAAESAPTAEMAAVPRAGDRKRGRVRLLAASVAVVGIALVAAYGWQRWQDRPAPAPLKKDWILVAEFDGPPGDSTLAPAAKSLLSAALEQSQLVETVPEEQIRQALISAGKPPSTRVDAEVARELAYRSAVRAVLEGSVGRLGKGYSIVLKVVDADTPRVILTRSGTAKDDDDLIPALGEMAKQLRRGLGENRAALRQTRPMVMAATPSFEAYRIYLEARRAANRWMLRETIRLCRRAVALDPGFASAWWSMRWAYRYLGDVDSARTCMNEFLRHKDRMTSRQLERIEVTQAFEDGDYPRVLAAYDRVLADDPGDLSALAGSNDALWAVGRVEEALARTRKAIQLAPFVPEVWRSNEVMSLEYLGRYDEARAALRPVTGNLRYWLLPDLELAAGRFAAAESIATATQSDPRGMEDNPAGLRLLIAAAQFGRGDVRAAAATMDEASRLLRESEKKPGRVYYRRALTEFSEISGGALPLPPDTADPDSSVRALLDRGLLTAARGDRALAARCLTAVRAGSRRDLERRMLPLLEARLATLSDRPREAVSLLRPLDREIPFSGASLTWVHWWLADAFEQMSEPDSAAFYLERTFSIAFDSMDGAYRPYVHHRLVLLYARLGRVADAERHLAAVEKMWDRPDPKVRRMLDEARDAVRVARGMTRPVAERS